VINHQPPPLVCTGRALDTHGRAAGTPCGNTYTARHRTYTIPGGTGDPRHDGWGIRPPTPAEQDTEARIKGWRLGPATDTPRHVMCPACARPDRATTAILRDLERSIR